jgi:sugar/nucleoside kinase (ribokinase family)
VNLCVLILLRFGLTRAQVEVTSVLGAGDALVAGLVWGLLGGRPLAAAMPAAMRCARAACRSTLPVPPELSPEMLCAD